MTAALGLEVPTALVDRWREWFAPCLQPFPTGRLGSDSAGIGRPATPSLSVRDTFHVYSDEGWTWLEEAEFTDLSLATRRALVHGRAATGRVRDVPDGAPRLAGSQRTDTRVVWWPTLLRLAGDQPLVDYVEHGLPPSRHREVTSSHWRGLDRILPGAADLVGRFPAASGPNCFSSVLAAAGMGDATAWSERAPFEEWLAAHTEPVRGTARDHLPGVVLVWRTHDGLAEHAAVTIGQGYTFSKPSQGWFSPYLVWTVPETIAASRYRGVVLNRYRIPG